MESQTAVPFPPTAPPPQDRTAAPVGEGAVAAAERSRVVAEGVSAVAIGANTMASSTAMGVASLSVTGSGLAGPSSTSVGGTSIPAHPPSYPPSHPQIMQPAQTLMNPEPLGQTQAVVPAQSRTSISVAPPTVSPLIHPPAVQPPMGQPGLNVVCTLTVSYSHQKPGCLRRLLIKHCAGSASDAR